jgi:hypothetical protein
MKQLEKSEFSSLLSAWADRNGRKRRTHLLYEISSARVEICFELEVEMAQSGDPSSRDVHRPITTDMLARQKQKRGPLLLVHEQLWFR